MWWYPGTYRPNSTRTMKVPIMLLHFSCNLTWVWKLEWISECSNSEMTWTFLSSQCFLLRSCSLHVFLESHYCWSNSVDQNCENIILLRALQRSSFSIAGNLKACATFHPLKLSSTIGNYVSNSSTCFLCPLPSPHPLSLLHCNPLHWILVRVCVSCGCDFYFCNPAS